MPSGPEVAHEAEVDWGEKGTVTFLTLISDCWRPH